MGNMYKYSNYFNAGCPKNITCALYARPCDFSL